MRKFMFTIGFLTFLSYALYHTTVMALTILRKKPFKNIVGKEENAGNQDFLLSTEKEAF